MSDFLAKTRKAWAVLGITIATPAIDWIGQQLGIDLVPQLDMTAAEAGSVIAIAGTAALTSLVTYLVPNRQ